MDFWTWVKNVYGASKMQELLDKVNTGLEQLSSPAAFRRLGQYATLPTSEKELPEYAGYEQYLKSPEYEAYLIQSGQKTGAPTGFQQLDPESYQLDFAAYQSNGGKKTYTEWVVANRPFSDTRLPGTDNDGDTTVTYWDEDGNQHRVDLLLGTDVIIARDPSKKETKPAPGGVEDIIDGGDGFRYKWNEDTGRHDIKVGSYDAARDSSSPNYRPDFTSGTPLPEGAGNVRWRDGYKEIYDPKGNNGRGEWVSTGDYDINKDPQYQLWQRQQAAQQTQAIQNLAWQQGQADLDRQSRQQEQQAQLAAQKQERLAQLAGTPSAWLQHATLSGQTPSVQPWMLPLMNQQYGITQAGQQLPGWQPPTTESGQPMTSLPELTRPSSQYQARMGSTGYQQYLGYQQARTGATPEDTQFQLWNYAPPSGRNRGLTYTR